MTDLEWATRLVKSLQNASTKVTRYQNAPHGWHDDAAFVYIGRPRAGADATTHFGNPFSHRTDTRATVVVATREEAVRLFAEWLAGQHPTLEPERHEWILALHMSLLLLQTANLGAKSSCRALDARMVV